MTTPTSDVYNYLKSFAPSVGPVRIVASSTFVEDETKNTWVVSGYQGADTPVKKQWKLYYDNGSMTHQEITPENWM